ncbi:MAG: carboxypeptidase regulatory-like domain-containing protein [Candidatus Sericytochromatia bacterium]|nr:carboxypeptidase regulatory-like domain-containing protein [Candidatus Sericytochromatia bacterium]
MSALIAALLSTQPLAAAPAPVQMASPPLVGSKTPAKTVRGHVCDAASGRPLAGALVQQEGGVGSVFSGADGGFTLLLETGAPAQLTLSAVGYEPATLALSGAAHQPLEVKMVKLSGFVPTAPQLSLSPAVHASDTAPLNTGLIFAYRFRQQTSQAGNAKIQGLANNDYRIGMRFRLRPLLFEAEGAHYETPVDMAGFDRTANPAFRPSTWQAGARIGLLNSLFHPDLELAGMAGYRWSNTVPNNNDVPYTGSDIDWEQTRQAFGPVGTLAWRPGRGPLHFEGSYGWYPWVLATAKAPGRPFGSQSLWDARAVVGYEVVAGMRIGLGYQAEQWSGQGDDLAQIYSLQMHYTPGGAPKGFEP